MTTHGSKQKPLDEMCQEVNCRMMLWIRGRVEHHLPTKEPITRAIILRTIWRVTKDVEALVSRVTEEVAASRLNRSELLAAEDFMEDCPD